MALGRSKKVSLLVLETPDETKEVAFELDYLSSLPLRDRFFLMVKKSRELKENLIKNGHRTPSAIIKRK
jgi:hypothetical protein